MDDVKYTKKRDGLRMMLMFYRNHGNLSIVNQNTGVSTDILRRFCDGEDCLTAEQDKALREPLGAYGSKEVKVSVDLKPKKAQNPAQ